MTIPSECVQESLVWNHQLDISKNSGTPKSSILIGFSIINHGFWGDLYFWKHPTVVNLAKESLAFPALSILGSEARRLLIMGGVIGGASDLGLGVGG